MSVNFKLIKQNNVASILIRSEVLHISYYNNALLWYYKIY